MVQSGISIKFDESKSINWIFHSYLSRGENHGFFGFKSSFCKRAKNLKIKYLIS